MAWLNLLWTLGVSKNNDRKGDEPSLQFAFVTIIDGTVMVHGHTTGCIENRPVDSFYFVNGNRRGNVRSGRNVPDEDNPFLGFVARAVEQDNSSDSMRRKDNEKFYENIRIVAQEVVNSGGIPTAGILWHAGNSAQLIDNFGDDDDKIGVSARVFHNFGTLRPERNSWNWDSLFELEESNSARPGTARIPSVLTVGDGPGHERIILVFEEKGGLYNFTAWLGIYENVPDPSYP